MRDNEWDFHFNGVGEAFFRSFREKSMGRVEGNVSEKFFLLFLCVSSPSSLSAAYFNKPSELLRKGKSIFCAHQKLIISSFFYSHIFLSRSRFGLKEALPEKKGNEIGKAWICLMAKKFFYDIWNVENR